MFANNPKFNELSSRWLGLELDVDAAGIRPGMLLGAQSRISTSSGSYHEWIWILLLGRGRSNSSYRGWRCLVRECSSSRRWRCLVRECGRTRSVENGEQIHGVLVKNGVAAAPFSFIYNALLYMYASASVASAAAIAFQHIPPPHRDVIDWTTLMSCYTRNALPHQAIRLFRTMITTTATSPDLVTMLCLFTASAQLKDPLAGAQVHLFVIKIGLPFTAVATNAAMDMYAKCGRISDARRMFQEMTNPTLVSWTIILSATLASDGVTSARQVFDGMLEKNEVAWTVMIAGYVQSGFSREALSLLHQMLSLSCAHADHHHRIVLLNHVTLCSLLSACSQSGDLTMGRWIHAYSIKTMMEDAQGQALLMVHTALVNMYSKCGNVNLAALVFNNMPRRNVVTWNAMMSGLAMHGLGQAAIHLFSRMIQEAQPDDITFVAILSACSHSGLVDQGYQYFHNLIPVYGIAPKVEHYACMVDLLGRAGHLEEAVGLVKEMPIRPNEVVLGSLFASCGLHGKLQLGEQLLGELLQLDPLNTQYHILLSNMYAYAGRQDAANATRQMLKNRGMGKVPGLSFIHVDGCVHQFSSGDKQHPRSWEIYAMLDDITQRLRLAGYMPDTSSQIFQFNSVGGYMDEKEEAEQSLFAHSERLAVSFGLISTRPRMPIHIFKNLRICQDCHTVFKFISDIFDREIVIALAATKIHQAAIAPTDIQPIYTRGHVGGS
ncbi:hypothetical protein ACLOJK_037700 [Asimina triloba]